jgi:hypothetical protein
MVIGLAGVGWFLMRQSRVDRRQQAQTGEVVVSPRRAFPRVQIEARLVTKDSHGTITIPLQPGD